MDMYNRVLVLNMVKQLGIDLLGMVYMATV